MFPGKLSSVNQMVRTLRILQGLLLAAAVGYALLPEYILREHPKPPKQLEQFVFLTIAVVAVASAAAAFLLGRWLIRRSGGKLLVQPDDRAAAMSFYMGYLIGMCVSLSIALYGLVLRFIGATLSQAAGFYVGGIVMLFLFTPRQPRAEGETP